MALEWAGLFEIDPEARARWGGKACGLARLHRAGVRVPEGLALAAGAPPPDAWAEGERAALCRALGALLARGPVAIRSSARAEDGEARSFAGIYETVLHVRDPAAALAAIARCLASGDAERARAYGGAERDAIGVVVQRQVDARAAGVLFTRDPDGRDAGAVLEAVRGLGEALVSGRREPSRWRAHRAGTGAVEVALEADGDGGTPGAAEAARVAEAGLSLAEALGGPLDLEWALDAEGALWWLQARPITALREPPPPPEVEPGCAGADDGPITVWTNLNVRETMPDPLAPLAWSLWRDRLVPAMGRLNLDFGEHPVARHLTLVDLLDGRPYWNVNAVLGVPGFRFVVESGLDVVDAAAGAAFAEVRERGVLFARRYPVGRLRFLASLLRAQCRGIAAILRALGPERSLRQLEAFGASMNERARGALGARRDLDLVAEIHEITSFDFMDVRRLFGSLFLAMGLFQLARHAYRDHPEAQALLAVGIPGNPTTGISLGVEELARRAAPVREDFLRGDPAPALLERLAGSAPGRAWLEHFERFLDHAGQRCPREFDLTAPRWSDDPGMLLDLIRAHLREPAKEGAAERLERLSAERRAALARAVARAPRWKRPWLRRVARLAERHLPLREAGKHHLLHVFARVRRLALELGARLAARGELGAAEDVFLLDLCELEDAVRGDLRGAALERRLARARARLEAQRLRAPVFFVRSDGVPVRAALAVPESGEGGALVGVGVATGTVRGRVRVLESPDPGALAAGEILVVHLADPGWTPLFPRAAGVVMEVGGLMCHAAVVARELGIPAVFGVRGARQRLGDGDLVELDADAGTVRRL